MYAIITVLPIIIIRYGLLYAVNKNSMNRASLYAPLIGKEKIAYGVYQITTLSIFVYLLFLRIYNNSKWFYVGLVLYSFGIILYAVATANFATPNKDGINQNGLYKISRNPMYVAYFLSFLGCAFLTHSWRLFILLFCFQVSAHWIILSEERWCTEKFGDTYERYMEKVKRYIL